jgi:hypothetical protein
MKFWICVVFLGTVSLFGEASALNQEQSNSLEQSRFSAEAENVQRPTSIPDDAWSILQKDSNVLDVLASQNLRAYQLPSSWFGASAIHLDG